MPPLAARACPFRRRPGAAGSSACSGRRSGGRRRAQEQGQGRSQIIQFFHRSPPHLAIAGNIKPGFLAVAQEELLLGRTVFPAHLAGLFQPQRSRLGALDSSPAVALAEFGLQRPQVIVVIVHGLSDGVNIGGRVRGKRRQKRQQESEKPGTDGNCFHRNPNSTYASVNDIVNVRHKSSAGVSPAVRRASALRSEGGTPSHGTAALLKALPKTKTSQTHRVMGRSSNSPPPKSAQPQPNVWPEGWEWPEWATRVGASVLARAGYA